MHPVRRGAAALLAVVVPLTGVSALNSAALAAEPTAQQTAASVSVPPSADTYVVAENPAQAYGTDSKLTAASWTDWHSETYLRFQVPPSPAGQAITSVRLELTFQRLDKQPSTVELHTLTGAWDEDTTYTNRPQVGALAATATLPGQGAPGVAFDLTGRVGPGDYAVALTNPNADSVASVYARERGADGPRLVIGYGKSTLCGAAFDTEKAGESYQEALAREDGYFGGLGTVRVFYSGLPKPWPGKLDTSGRPMIISFKSPPAEVAAGAYDTQLGTWFKAAPRDRDIYWTFWHEPEDNVENPKKTPHFPAADFRAAWQHLAGLARAAGNPRLHATLILMGYTLSPASKRHWLDYYPGSDAVDVLAWDVYNSQWDDKQPGYLAPETMFANVIAVSRAEGKPFGIAETGSPLIANDGGSQRAAWLRTLTEHLAGEGALFVSYFDLLWTDDQGKTSDYRLRDPESIAAWREFCS